MQAEQTRPSLQALRREILKDGEPLTEERLALWDELRDRYMTDGERQTELSYLPKLRSEELERIETYRDFMRTSTAKDFYEKNIAASEQVIRNIDLLLEREHG